LPDFEQQLLVHLPFFFVLPVSAKERPVIKNAAVANKNTFFILVSFWLIGGKYTYKRIFCQAAIFKL